MSTTDSSRSSEPSSPGAVSSPGSDARCSTIGAVVTGDGTCFRVWAPRSERVEVLLESSGEQRALPLQAENNGWFSLTVPGVGAGTRYRYRLDGGDVFPDPLSRFQPEGVHGPSEVVDPSAFEWTDASWPGLVRDEAVIYEVHVGTATEEGTFDALAARLDDLVELGITALEVMPVAQFPGERNWGYDGTYWYAPAHSYGGPEGLRRLVNAAHERGLGVIMDVVYNHLGPEGNYLPAFSGGLIFTEKHHTPWGAAINYDDHGSEAVREIVVQNALHWITEYHIDGLRLDAAHAIVDDSPRHLLQELADRVRGATDRPVLLIAEDERNERLVVTSEFEGGLGLDAVWADDLHHQLRRLTAGDSEGYYSAYTGSVADVVRTLENGWFYQGEVYEPTGEERGTPAAGLSPTAFVHCIQNHDQVGNRATGERLNHQIDLGRYRALSALLLLSPYTPMLWMGQEWAASSPFLYFTDHPEELGRLVTKGRREEFKHFSAFQDPEQRERIPDPQAESTFERSRLRWDEAREQPHAGVRALYRELLSLRRQEAALRTRDRESFRAGELGESALSLQRSSPRGSDLLLVADFAGGLRVALDERSETRPPTGQRWQLLLATEEERFGGDGRWGRLDEAGTLELTSPGAVILRAETAGS